MDTLKTRWVRRTYWVDDEHLEKYNEYDREPMYPRAKVDALVAEQEGEMDGLYKESLADRKLIEVLKSELQKQTSYAAALQREVAAAKADFEKQKTMTRLEAKANYNAIDEIHLLEAQRDRAEAACAEWRRIGHTAMDLLVELSSDRPGYDAEARARFTADAIAALLAWRQGGEK